MVSSMMEYATLHYKFMSNAVIATFFFLFVFPPRARIDSKNREEKKTTYPAFGFLPSDQNEPK